jgi:DNA-binding NtrC family response regulator
MLTGQGTIETAVRAMKLGAYDYLTKPFALAELEILIEKAYDRRLLRKENQQLKQVLERQQQTPLLVGESPEMQELARLIQRVANTDKPVLIQGESGTGKELVVREIHRHSSRADKPLVVINCAAVPESLLESEFFGHEKGAFTGATTLKPGLFEVADGGTLFIDEIGELAPTLQAKLLRVLEDGSLRRIGSIKERRVDVRVLAATNRNLQTEAAAGRFREDLYYRLNVLSLDLPPLRNRRSDIPLLVRHYLGNAWQINPRALESLQSFAWPGNVRQLINTLERAKIMSDDHVIEYEDLPAEIIDTTQKTLAATGSEGEEKDGDKLADLQRSHVLDVLRRENGNKARASRVLGIARRSLYRLMDKYDLHQQFARPSGNNS